MAEDDQIRKFLDSDWSLYYLWEVAFGGDEDAAARESESEWFLKKLEQFEDAIAAEFYGQRSRIANRFTRVNEPVWDWKAEPDENTEMREYVMVKDLIDSKLDEYVEGEMARLSSEGAAGDELDFHRKRLQEKKERVRFLLRGKRSVC